MPKKYANDYNGLRTAIEAATPIALEAINKIIRNTSTEVLAQRINPNPKHPNNPSLLAIALTAKTPSLEILKKLLSVKGVDVISKHNKQGHTVSDLLNKATGLSLDQKAELRELMLLRGLPVTQQKLSDTQSTTRLEDQADRTIVPPNTPTVGYEASLTLANDDFSHLEQGVLHLLAQIEQDNQPLPRDIAQLSSAALLAKAKAILAEPEPTGIDLSALDPTISLTGTYSEDTQSAQDSLATQADWDAIDEWLELGDLEQAQLIEDGFLLVNHPPVVAQGGVLGGMGGVTGTSPTSHVEFISARTTLGAL